MLRVIDVSVGTGVWPDDDKYAPGGRWFELRLVLAIAGRKVVFCLTV